MDSRESITPVEDAIQNSKCKECPLVIHAAVDADDVAERSESLTEMALSISPAEEQQDAKYLFQSELGEIIRADGIDSPDELLEKFHENALETLESNEEVIDKIRNLVADYSADCEGPLKLRARRNGRVVVATMCHSPEAPDDFSCETLHIERSTDSAS